LQTCTSSEQSSSTTELRFHSSIGVWTVSIMSLSSHLSERHPAGLIAQSDHGKQYSDVLHAATVSGEFIALWQSNPPVSVIGDRRDFLLRDAPGVAPPSRRRSGCSLARPYPPARRFDYPQGMAEDNQVAYLLRSNCSAISMRRSQLLTINEERM